jgi:molybdopterin-containing oxidoreductase family iron-sulfur binding subunit
MNDDLGRMVLIRYVRSRGVMEKMFYVYQMTQATILMQKKKEEVVVDGEFQTACSNACSNRSNEIWRYDRF